MGGPQPGASQRDFWARDKSQEFALQAAAQYGATGAAAGEVCGVLPRAVLGEQREDLQSPGGAELRPSARLPR